MGTTQNKESTKTEPPPYNTQQPWGFNAFDWRQIFALNDIVVKTEKKMFSLH